MRAQTEFPVESVFEAPSTDGRVGCSTFIIAGPTVADAAVDSEGARERDILARFAAEGRLTRNDVGVGEKGGGTLKIAWTSLVKRKRIVKTGHKRGRSDLWRLADEPDAAGPELFSEPGHDEPGHEPGQPRGQAHPESAQTPVAQGIEPGRRTWPLVGQDGPHDRPDDREAPAAPRAGAPASHHDETNLANLANPYRGGQVRGQVRKGDDVVTPSGPSESVPERDGVLVGAPSPTGSERKACGFPVGAPGARFCRRCGFRTDAHSFPANRSEGAKNV